MNSNGLIRCPQCLTESGKHRTLGSINPDGILAILAAGKDRKLIFVQGTNLTIGCECGFIYRVDTQNEGKALYTNAKAD